ncbi:hypothetical protein CRYUN_Cryun01aG0096200 [Craigia yunnanensis]
MARKFKNAREKLDAIAGEKTKFHLREGVGEIEIQRIWQRQTSSLVKESEVYGRSNEKENIFSLLLNNLSQHDDLSVYAICRMGGLGKTTFAQLVYNDENVRKAFDLRVWVCVSDDFDIKRLTKAIVESIEGNSCNIQELDPLQRRLEEKLVGKRFLLVLDDVWNEYHDKWDGLKQALRRGVKGSTVIVTTRIEKVALMMAIVNPVCRLGCLSDDDSWSLFKQRESEWLHVKDSKIWDLADEGSRILAVLRSSSTTIVDIPKLQSLRSLILRSEFGFGINLCNPSHFTEQKHLMVLDFGGRFKNISGDYLLKHLRYLNLSYSEFKTLPESISDLHNLQTLNLGYCTSLRMLPKGMKNLKNHLYLDITNCRRLTCMPVGLANLSCLRKLNIIVGMDRGLRINELKELALEGELSIKELYNVKSSAEAKNVNLIEKPNLRSLSLSWRVNNKELSQHENAEEILNGLQPHSSLKKLSIIDYQGLRFPYWMMDLLLPNLVEISLQNCERCDQLPPLGKLRFLKRLSIYGMGALKSIDINFHGDGESSFPSLKKLVICDAQRLEEWTAVNGRDNFHLLSSLSVIVLNWLNCQCFNL